MELDKPRWHSRTWLIAGLGIVFIVLVISLFGIDSPSTAVALLAVAMTVALAVIVWAQRQVKFQRRRYEDELTVWAAERATQAERLRIAADLHDLVSHGLGLITIRAAAATSAGSQDAANEQRAALTDIERASRETTTELRRMLTVLREPGAAPLRPADTLEDLPSIVQAANAAGLTAALEIDEVGAVSSGVQLTVCAVVREALNNTLRHAGPTMVHVSVRSANNCVIVDISDSGPVAQWEKYPGAGHGLRGLRERVGSLGGVLQAEAGELGFHVHARIPDTLTP